MPTWAWMRPCPDPARAPRRDTGYARRSSSISACTRGSPAATIRPPSSAGSAVPGCDTSASTFDDGDQGHDVVRLQASLDHHVDQAGRQQAIAVAVAAVARHARARLDARVSRSFRGTGEHVGVGAGDDSFRQCATGARLEAARPPVRPAHVRGAAVTPEPLASEGLVHDAEQRPAAVDEADERAPQGTPHDERARSVDGVDDPLVAAGPLDRGELLAHDAVIGEASGDGRANRPLRGPVGGRHRIEAGACLLVGHAQRTAEVG